MYNIITEIELGYNVFVTILDTRFGASFNKIKAKC